MLSSCIWTRSYWYIIISALVMLHQDKEISCLLNNICPKEFLILSQGWLLPLPWYLYNKMSDPHSFDHLVPRHSKWGSPPILFPSAPAHSSGTNREQWRLALLHNGWCTSSKEPQLVDTIFSSLTAQPLMLTVRVLHFKSGPGSSHCRFPCLSCLLINCS